MKLFTKTEVDYVDELLAKHYDKHSIDATICFKDCKKLALMLSINSVIEARNILEEKKPCKGRNINVCVAEGCFKEACVDG